MAWLKLTDENGFPVYVNTDHVSHIQPYPHEDSDTCMLMLSAPGKSGGNIKIPVKHTPEEIMNMTPITPRFET